MRIASYHRIVGAVIGASLAAGAAGAQDRALRIVGVDSQPVPFAYVQANGGNAMLSDEMGRVSLGAGKKQTLTIEVRRIGYTPFYGKIEFPDTAITIPVTLATIAQQLSSVKVTTSKSPLERSGFYKRWLDGQKGVTSAVFIGPEELDKRNASRVSVLLGGVNGVRIARTNTGNNVIITGAATCGMAIIVDGRQVCPNAGCKMQDEHAGLTDMNSVAIDQVIDLTSVAGIEVYRRGGNMPSDFHVDGECGAVALWTGSRKP